MSLHFSFPFSCYDNVLMPCVQMSNMPSIPTSPALTPSSSSFDLPTLHVGATITLDREARVNRLALAFHLLLTAVCIAGWEKHLPSFSRMVTCDLCALVTFLHAHLPIL